MITTLKDLRPGGAVLPDCDECGSGLLDLTKLLDVQVRLACVNPSCAKRFVGVPSLGQMPPAQLGRPFNTLTLRMMCSPLPKSCSKLTSQCGPAAFATVKVGLMSSCHSRQLSSEKV
jgi:hypothetical protein